jgi:hypothetical protein
MHLLGPGAGALLGLLLVAALAIASRSSPMSWGPTYTLPALQAQVARQPSAWRTRIVLVRAVALACVSTVSPAPDRPWCLEPSLSDAGPPDSPARLPFSVSTPSPLLAFLQRVPVLAGLVRTPQMLRWGTVATYRIQLRAVRAGSCLAPPCFEAQILDVAP